MAIIRYEDMSLKRLYREQAEAPDCGLIRALILRKQAERNTRLSVAALVISLVALAARFLGFY